MGAALVFLIIALLSLAPAVEDWALPMSMRVQVQKSLNLSIGKRMERISRPLLGKPYLIDPVGEGNGVDPDPLSRYDAYDCLTFVEETLSFALSFDHVSAHGLRNKLRYQNGVVHYRVRKHFMFSQWIFIVY